jgi:hypothetical protein
MCVGDWLARFTFDWRNMFVRENRFRRQCKLQQELLVKCLPFLTGEVKRAAEIVLEIPA